MPRRGRMTRLFRACRRRDGDWRSDRRRVGALIGGQFKKRQQPDSFATITSVVIDTVGWPMRE